MVGRRIPRRRKRPDKDFKPDKEKSPALHNAGPEKEVLNTCISITNIEII